MQLRPSALVALVLSLCACSSTSTSPPTSGTPAVAQPGETSTPEEPEPAAPGATLTAYTQAEVQKLFDARCVRCHDAESPNLDLSAPFARNTIGVATGGESGKTTCGRDSEVALRIKPGDRDGSLLWHKVKGTQDCGNPMPYEKADKPLSATELERLGLYIDGLK